MHLHSLSNQDLFTHAKHISHLCKKYFKHLDVSLYAATASMGHEVLMSKELNTSSGAALWQERTEVELSGQLPLGE